MMELTFHFEVYTALGTAGVASGGVDTSRVRRIFPWKFGEVVQGVDCHEK